MDNKAIIIFNIVKQNISIDLEIPLDISTRDLVVALNQAFNLGIDTSDIKECYLKVENPVMLMRGNKLLSEYGIRNGSIINYTR